MPITEQSTQSMLASCGQPDLEAVHSYFWGGYLRHQGRMVFSVAARMAKYDAPGCMESYTLSDIAANLGGRADYASVKSWYRMTHESARRWKQEVGTEAPIRFESLSYEWIDDEQGCRTRYRLPWEVAEMIDKIVMRPYWEDAMDLYLALRSDRWPLPMMRRFDSLHS
jgi:hypothetical protein